MISATQQKRGGGHGFEIEGLNAATQQKLVGDTRHGTANVIADLPSGGTEPDSETLGAAGEKTGVNPSVTDHDGAQDGRATSTVEPVKNLRGRSKTKRGAGEKDNETDDTGAGSADTTNGAAVEVAKPPNQLPRRSRTSGKGEHTRDTDVPTARPAETNGRANAGPNPSVALHGQPVDGVTPCVPDCAETICRQLKPLQCARVAALKMRIRVDNGIGSFVARLIGDGADKSEADRQKLRKIADELVACVWKDKPLKHPEHEAIVTANAGIIGAAGTASTAFQKQIDFYEKQMESLVKQLPIAAWLDEPEQRGIGLVSVAKIIGECETDLGSLPGYRNPSCVWKRMGCAPHNGKMPATWRSGKEGKASAEDWVAMGYNPRRRSLMYVIGEGIVKQNGDGPYRKRYDEAKATFQEKHPDYSKGRCHSHGMLLASKLLLKNLWIQMRGETA